MAALGGSGAAVATAGVALAAPGPGVAFSAGLAASGVVPWALAGEADAEVSALLDAALLDAALLVELAAEFEPPPQAVSPARPSARAAVARSGRVRWMRNRGTGTPSGRASH